MAVVRVWRNVSDVIVCLLVLTMLLFVDFQLSVKFSWRMGLLEEQEGAVVGVFWPLPSDPASLNAHFQL